MPMVLVHGVQANFAQKSRESDLGARFQFDFAKHHRLISEKGFINGPEVRFERDLFKREVAEVRVNFPAEETFTPNGQRLLGRADLCWCPRCSFETQVGISVNALEES